MKKRVIQIVAIIIFSLFLNWFVQLSFYLYTVNLNPLAFQGQKTLLQYLTGVLGDGVIAPMINVLVFVFFYHDSFKTAKENCN